MYRSLAAVLAAAVVAAGVIGLASVGPAERGRAGAALERTDHGRHRDVHVPTGRGPAGVDPCVTVPAAAVRAATGQLDHAYACERVGDGRWRWSPERPAAGGDRVELTVRKGESLAEERHSLSGGTPFNGIGRGGWFALRPVPRLVVAGADRTITVTLVPGSGGEVDRVPSAARLGMVADAVMDRLAEGRELADGRPASV